MYRKILSKGAKKVSKTMKNCQKGSQNERRNLQRHSCGTGSRKVFKKGAKRCKPVFPPNSLKWLLWILTPPNSQNATFYKSKAYSCLKSSFRKQIYKKVIQWRPGERHCRSQGGPKSSHPPPGDSGEHIPSMFPVRGNLRRGGTEYTLTARWPRWERRSFIFCCCF